ncbi:MAG: glycosyltransferase family 2 protein [Lachnospiraceae bacterium]|nr:glycosyltransferase family 2 protein [Lachnospiraceae bacterium]
MTNSTKTKVTTIVPAYNAAAYINRAVDSVLEQDDHNLVIVVDDCSTDDTEDRLSIYADNPRVTVVRQEQNSGVAAARNKGIELCKTEYVAFLDADDFWKPGKLAAELRMIENTKVSLVCCARELFTSEGESLGRVIGVRERISRADLLRTNIIPCGSVLVSKNIVSEFGFRYSQYHEDYILWLKITEKYGPAGGINEPFLCSVLSEGGKSRNKFRSAMMQYGSLKCAGVGFFARIPYMISYMVEGLKKYHG